MSFKRSLRDAVKGTKGGSKRKLPKIDFLLKWGVVKDGDLIVAKGRDSEATLLANGRVKVGTTEKSMQAWLKEVYGWAAVDNYAFAVYKDSGKTLAQIREEYMASTTNALSEET